MLDSIVQLLTVLLIFIFVLALTYFTTKLTAGFQKGRYQSANVEIIETLRIAPTKYIQIVRIGEKYYSYVVPYWVSLQRTILRKLLKIMKIRHR